MHGILIEQCACLRNYFKKISKKIGPAKYNRYIQCVYTSTLISTCVMHAIFSKRYFTEKSNAFFLPLWRLVETVCLLQPAKSGITYVTLTHSHPPHTELESGLDVGLYAP